MKSILTAALLSLAMATTAFAQATDSDDATTGNPAVNGSNSDDDNSQAVQPNDPNVTKSTKSQGDSPAPCSDADALKNDTMTSDNNDTKTSDQNCEK